MLSGVGRQRTSGCGRFGGHGRTMPSWGRAGHGARPTPPEEHPCSPSPPTSATCWAARCEPCGVDPVTGFYRDGHCTSGPEDLGSHTVCSVVSAEFLALQRELGNDLITPRPEYGFPGLKPGDRWCVVAVRWLQAYQAGTATGVVLAATNARALEIVPIEALRQHAVDVPDDASGLS